MQQFAADDDEEDRELTRDALQDARLANEMKFVVDGQDLMDYLKREGAYADPSVDAPRPGIILLDLNMPKKDGRGMPDTPFGPPVRLCQLMMTRRMISPKASVTMAR